MVAGEDIRCVGGVELSGISWVIITLLGYKAIRLIDLREA